MSLGSILRKTRESRNFTASQVAAATHMKVQTVEAIEKEDFSQMPAAIYSKGFIKLYAEYLGLDPDPLTREYVERFVEPPPPPEPEQEDEPEDFLIKPGNKDDMPRVAEKTNKEDHAHDLFSYGKRRKENPPENLFEHKIPKQPEIEAESGPSIADRLSAVSSKLKDAVSILSKQLSEKTDSLKESFRKKNASPGLEHPQDKHMVDTSPITLPHRKLMIISGIIAVIVIIVLIISSAARFSRDRKDVIYPDDTEQELILPGRIPPPFID